MPDMEIQNVAALRVEAFKDLAPKLIEVYMNLLESPDEETRLKAAKQVQELLGADKGAGGTHQKGLSFTAQLGEDAMRGMFQGIARLTQGETDESTEVAPTDAEVLPVSWSEDDEQQASDGAQ